MIQQELVAGLRLILDTLQSHRAASHLKPISDTESRVAHESTEDKKTVAKKEVNELERKSLRTTRHSVVQDTNRSLNQEEKEVEMLSNIECEDASQNQTQTEPSQMDTEIPEESTVTISLTEAMEAMSNTLDCDTANTVESTEKENVEDSEPTNTALSESTDLINTGEQSSTVDTENTVDTEAQMDTAICDTSLMSNTEQDTEFLSPASTASTLSTRLSFDDLMNINVSMSNMEELGTY